MEVIKEMDAVLEDVLYERKYVIEQVSRSRRPERKGWKVSQSTFYRWCVVAGIETGLNEFTADQYGLLVRVANFYRQGYKEEKIKEKLNDTSSSNTNQSRSPRQGFRAESQGSQGFSWSNIGSRFTG